MRTLYLDDLVKRETTRSAIARLFDEEEITEIKVEGYSVLSIACMHGFKELVEPAIQNGCDVNRLDKEYRTVRNRKTDKYEDKYFDVSPLYLTLRDSEYHQADIVEMLFKHGASLDETSREYFIKNCKADQFKLLKVLVNHGFDINGQDDEGNTCFHKIVDNYRFHNKQNLTEVLDYFIELGFKFETENKRGESVFKLIAKTDGFDKLEVFKRFEENKIDFVIQEENKRTLLFDAVYYYSHHQREKGITFINYLIEKGFDVHAKDSKGETVLAMMKGRNCRDKHLMALLMTHGADTDELQSESYSSYGNSYGDFVVSVLDDLAELKMENEKMILTLDIDEIEDAEAGLRI